MTNKLDKKFDSLKTHMLRVASLQDEGIRADIARHVIQEGDFDGKLGVDFALFDVAKAAVDEMAEFGLFLIDGTGRELIEDFVENGEDWHKTLKDKARKEEKEKSNK